MFNRVRQSSKSLDTMEQQELGMQQHLDSQKGDRANENGNAMSGNAQVYNFPIVPVPAKMSYISVTFETFQVRAWLKAYALRKLCVMLFTRDVSQWLSR